MDRYTVEHIQPEGYYRIFDNKMKLNIASTTVPRHAEEICEALNRAQKKAKVGK